MSAELPTGSPGERAIFGFLIALVGVIVVVVGGAELAAVVAGHHLVLTERVVAAALEGLPRHLTDPRLAWGSVDRPTCRDRSSTGWPSAS